MSGWLGFVASAAFLAGLAGGVHCAAMCGPIIAACARPQTGPSGWRRALAYNAGRIASYTAAGVFAGLIGNAALTLRGGMSLHTALAAASGVALSVLALHLAGVTPVTRALESAGALLWRRVQPYSKQLLPANTLPRVLALGALWGWLPCGMVYAVLITAVATASPAEGALVMFAFGLGTLPNLLALGMAAGRLARAMQRRLVRLAAAAVVGGFGALGLSFALDAHAWTVGTLICRVVPGAELVLR